MGHRRVLLSSPTHQITAIRVNYMSKNVSNELYCKTADSPKQKCVFAPMLFFSGNANGNTYKSDHWIMRINSNLQEVHRDNICAICIGGL